MHPALERKGLIYYAVEKFLRQNYSKQEWNLDLDIRKLAKANAWLGEPNSAPQAALSKAYEISSMVLTQRYDETVKNDAAFKHRNPFRDQETIKAINKGTEPCLGIWCVPSALVVTVVRLSTLSKVN